MIEQIVACPKCGYAVNCATSLKITNELKETLRHLHKCNPNKYVIMRKDGMWHLIENDEREDSNG